MEGAFLFWISFNLRPTQVGVLSFVTENESRRFLRERKEYYKVVRKVNIMLLIYDKSSIVQA